MIDTTPEEKLLDTIKKAQGRLRLKNELKVFVKVIFALSVLIIIILAIFLADIFVVPAGENQALETPLKAKRDKPLLTTRQDVSEEEKTIAEGPEKDTFIPEEDFAKNLNLVGIVRGDDDQAIIEDTERNKRFFLYRGQAFNGFRLFSIRENSVVLDYNGKKIELAM